MKPELFLQQLRTRTLPYHQAIEEIPSAKILLSKEVTIADYLTYLTKLYGFVFPFEKNVFPLLASELSDLGLREKAKLLQEDFSMAPIPKQNISALPDTIFSGAYDTTAKAWGGMYVMEGSVLGGKSILRHLQKTLPDSLKWSAYFTCYGHQTGSMWSTFLNKFSEETTTLNKEEEIIDSAIQTFTILTNWMNNSFKQQI